MNYQEALKVVKTISIYYQNFVITEERVKEWALVIQEYELNQVLNNLKEYTKENKFPPTLADLIQQDSHNKRAAYLPNTAESMQEQALEAARLLQQIEEPKKFNGLNLDDDAKKELQKLIGKLRGGN